jgi:hypothetical protein
MMQLLVSKGSHDLQKIEMEIQAGALIRLIQQIRVSHLLNKTLLLASLWRSPTRTLHFVVGILCMQKS